MRRIAEEQARDEKEVAAGPGSGVLSVSETRTRSNTYVCVFFSLVNAL